MKVDIPLVLASLCLLYYLVIVFYAGITTDFAWIWPAAAAMLLLTRISGIGRWMWLPILTATAGLILLLVPIIRGMHINPERGLIYVIVEGAQVKGTKPSRSLRRRLECAAAYAQENPATVLILSGGQGSGEDISEAACMEAYLTAEGIGADRLIIEDLSTTTRENLLYSNKLTGCAAESVGLITNDFHVYRSKLIAERLGYEDVHGIPAKSDPVLQLHFMVREAAALVKERLRG